MLVARWGVNVILAAVAGPMNVALQAMGAYRALAWLDVAAAAICAGATFPLLAHFDAGSSILAILLGQVTQIVAMMLVLARFLRRGFPAPSAPSRQAAPVQHGSGDTPARIEQAIAQVADLRGAG
jgi:hypothetical protein